jgi:hypothetical protein
MSDRNRFMWPISYTLHEEDFLKATTEILNFIGSSVCFGSRSSAGRKFPLCKYKQTTAGCNNMFPSFRQNKMFAEHKRAEGGNLRGKIGDIEFVTNRQSVYS